MKHLGKTAGLLCMIAVAVIVLSAGNAGARYLFDDVIGNGKSSQWMVISGTGNSAEDTFGANYAEPIDVSGDLVSNTDAVLYVMNGGSTTDVANRNIHTVFLVLEEGQGRFDLNLGTPSTEWDVSGGNVNIGTNVEENRTSYAAIKTSLGTPSQTSKTYYNAGWSSYRFELSRSNPSTYDTVVQRIYFGQLPSTAPSQGAIKPFVISNVKNGPADESNPLVLRMTLRDAQSNGNIIAYNHDTWAMTGNKRTERQQWVFVPVDDLNIGNRQINRYLTTEVANRSGIRYAARYYDSAGGYMSPTSWKFDLFRPQGTVNIERNFLLAEQSNIPPGLVAVYNRPCNVNEQNIVPLHLYAVESTTYPGDYSLTLNHKIIFGRELGTYKEPAQTGSFNMYEVTAFKPNPASTSFLSDVARTMKSTGTVSFPDTPIFTSGSVNTNNPIAGGLTHYFTVNQNIPSGMRGTNEGMLPLHITFNLPITGINDSEWLNNLMQAWRNTGTIEEIFANKYELYLMVTKNGVNNIWNMTQELKRKGHYNDIVKVFFDDERPASTQDNDRGLITVSFMTMLMNGTRGNDDRPALQIVSDSSNVQQNNYMILKDGVNDSSWNMTFFVAPTGWSTNNNISNWDNTTSNTTTSRDTSSNSGVSGSSGGSGGCASVSGILLASISCIALCSFQKRERRR